MFNQQLSQSTGSKVITPFADNDFGSGFGLEAQDVTLPPIQYSDPESESDLDDEPLSAHPLARKHSYRPLKPNEIRLLVLNPGMPEDPVECYLEHYPVNTAKPYRALSYVWGDALDQQVILLDGSEFKVNKNLAEFLVSFRTWKDCDVLWIDALCINQEDILERNSQIKLMKRLYENTSSVIIWLGSPSEYTTHAFKHLVAVYQRVWKPLLSKKGSVNAALSSMSKTQLLDAVAIGQTATQIKNTFLGIQDILSRPWWTRIWVYQEATAPAKRESTLCCGKNYTSFDALIVFCRMVRQLGSTKFNTDTVFLMDIYSQLRYEFNTSGTSDYLRLEDLLPNLRNFASTNPRDKLYALIPISLDGGKLLDVDYSLSVEEVYVDATANIIEKHGNLAILGHCTDNRNSILDLPSWVPDWTCDSAAMHFFKRGRASHWNGKDIFPLLKNAPLGRLYSASHHSKSNFRVDRATRRLICQGVLFDDVASVGPDSEESDTLVLTANKWMEWLSQIGFDVSAKQSSYLGTISGEEAFLRTLVADCYRIGVDVGVRLQRDMSDALLNSMKEIFFGKGERVSRIGINGLHPAVLQRRLILTKTGYLGVTSNHVEPGDLVTILEGGELPFVLRKITNHFVLIGEAYIHGIMDGEAINIGTMEMKRSQFELW
jgi:Heterokaryon incompatibility protein (HET)